VSPQPVRLATSLACALAALTGPALAQNAPLPAPSPTPSATPAPKPVADKSTSFSHLPILDIVPTFSQQGPFDTAAQAKGYVPFDIDGTIKIPLTRSLSFSFDKIGGAGFNNAPERIIGPAGPVYPPNFRDVQLTERLDYQIKNFVIEGGLSFRHRLQDLNGGVSGAPFPYTISSTEAHFGYLGVSYTSPPIRALAGSQFILGVNGYEQPVDKHVAVLNPTTHLVNYIPESPNQNRFFETQQQVGVIVPVDPKHGFSVSARDLWGAANFYENSPFPWYWDADIVLAATKKFNNYFSLTLRATDQHYAPQGFPFPTPNVNHVEGIDVLADFHLDTNTLVHRK
jgi:hypothetical protein